MSLQLNLYQKCFALSNNRIANYKSFFVFYLLMLYQTDDIVERLCLPEVE